MSVIGVGVDLVDLARVTRMLDAKGEHAMRRLFTEGERAYLAARPDPTGHAAARIAAKEAVYKALQSLPGARAIGWREIEVVRDEDGRPAIRLHGLAARLAGEVGGVGIQVSLTHSATAAGAVAVVSSPPIPPMHGSAAGADRPTEPVGLTESVRQASSPATPSAVKEP